MLGRHPCALKLLFTAFPGLRGKTLSLALGIGNCPLCPIFGLAEDSGRCRLQPSLINDCRGFVVRLRQQRGGILARLREHPRGFLTGLGEQLIGLVARPREHVLSLSASVLERYLCFPKSALGGVPVSFGSQLSTLQCRFSLQLAALDNPVRLHLPGGRRAFTGRRLLVKLAGFPGRTAGTKPLAHQLEMTVNLSRVITLAYTSKVTLDHVRRTSLTFLAGRHSAAVRYRIPDSFAIRPTPISAWIPTSATRPTSSGRKTIASAPAARDVRNSRRPDCCRWLLSCIKR